MVTVSVEVIFNLGAMKYISLGDEQFYHQAKECFLWKMRRDKTMSESCL